MTKRARLAIVKEHRLAPSELCRALTDKNVDQYRRTDCVFVDLCIDVALENKWDGFTCNGCTGYSRIAEDATDYQRGESALAAADAGGPAARRHYAQR